MLPALPPATEVVISRQAQHAQQADHKPQKHATPPKSSENDAVIDLLDSDDDSPPNANTSVAPAQAAAVAVAEPVTMNVVRAGPLGMHAEHAHAANRGNRQSHRDSTLQCTGTPRESPWGAIHRLSSQGLGSGMAGRGPYGVDPAEEPGPLEYHRAVHVTSPPLSFAPGRGLARQVCGCGRTRHACWDECASCKGSLSE